ncbi:hypothetical protein QJQ45_007497 [Haematococcus lacustris]|nr:hypothetical protein QJQ45_007497 [Haematococcus lacustris]
MALLCVLCVITRRAGVRTFARLRPSIFHPADWVPPAGRVAQRLVRPVTSQRHGKYVRGLLWCHEVPPNPPPPTQAPLPRPPLPRTPLAQDPPAPAPAQDHLPLPHQPGSHPPPLAQAQAPPAAPGPVPPPQAPPWGRWLNRDTNSCLNFPRIGESMQRPLKLCSWTNRDRRSLPKEYQQRYKLVNDWLPKGRQRLHRAAEYRRGINGRAHNNL